MTGSLKHTGESAEVVALPTRRSSTAKSSNLLRSRQLDGLQQKQQTASLLSIRQNLNFKALVGVDNLTFIEQNYSTQVAQNLRAMLRNLLDQEFGNLRVHRKKQSFVVNHHCMESLIAGLLRVQFHARKVALTATHESTGDPMSDLSGICVSWGVGNTINEAERDRSKNHLG